MAHRKNTKRIDPRHFLHETVDRGEELEEGWGFRDDEKDKPYLGKYAGGSEGLPTKQTPEDPWGTSAEETFFGNGGTGDVREKDPHSQSQIRGKRAAEQDRISMQRKAKALRAQGKNKKADFLVGAWKEREALRRRRGGLAESETGPSGLGETKESEGKDLDEDCGVEGHEGGEAVDISAPGTEVHVDDISQLSPEEAFAAGLAAARDAIDQAMGGPDGPPPEGGFGGSGPMGEPAAEEE